MVFMVRYGKNHRKTPFDLERVEDGTYEFANGQAYLVDNEKPRYRMHPAQCVGMA